MLLLDFSYSTTLLVLSYLAVAKNSKLQTFPKLTPSKNKSIKFDKTFCGVTILIKFVKTPMINFPGIAFAVGNCLFGMSLFRKFIDSIYY